MPGPIKIFSGLRRRFQYWRRDLAWKMGMGHSFVKKAKGARIIVYHGICNSDHLRFNSLFLKLETFDAHLQFYKKHFNVVSLDDFYQKRFRDDRFNVCLTFDDGFANNYKYVLPLLERYEIPSAFFITGIRDAGYDILWNDFLTIGSKSAPEKILFRKDEFVKNKLGRYISVVNKKPLATILRNSDFSVKAEFMRTFNSVFLFRNFVADDYWLQMTPEQIKKLSESPWVTIGSHGYYHNDLEKIEKNEAKEEMEKSKLYLEELTGKEVMSLAFPYGSYSRNLIETAKKTGYAQLLATTFHFEEDKTDTTLKERITINPFISVYNQMHAIIAGNYD